jgi:hypothetical protein
MLVPMSVAQNFDPRTAFPALSVRRSPFTVHRSPFAVHRSPFAVRRSPFAVRRSPFAVHLSPLASPSHLSPAATITALPDCFDVEL